MPQTGVKSRELEAVSARIENLLRKSGETSSEAQELRRNIDLATTSERDADAFGRDYSFGKAAHYSRNAANIYKMLGMNESASDTFLISANFRALEVKNTRLREMNHEMSPEGIASYILEKRENLIKIQEINHQARQLLEAFVDSGKPINAITEDMRDALWKAKALASGIAIHYIREEDLRRRQYGLHSEMFGEDALRYLFYAAVAENGEEKALGAVADLSKWLASHYDDAIAKMDGLKQGLVENTEKIVGDLKAVAARN